MRERLHRLAAEENPGGTVQSICRKIYSKQGQQKVEVDAAVVVRFPADQPPVAYLAERKRTLNLNAFYEVENKWALIRLVPPADVSVCCSNLWVLFLLKHVDCA